MSMPPRISRQMRQVYQQKLLRRQNTGELIRPVVDMTPKRAIETPDIPRLSVIICTYNRCELALATLDTLRQQSLTRSQFEVIVVDNGSVDGSYEAIQLYLKHHKQQEEGWQVQCIQETRNGVAHARTTGMSSAVGEILVFLDDDTLASTCFLEQLLQTYDETGAAAVGGSVDLYWEARRPFWLNNNQLEMLGYFAPFSTRTVLPVEINLSSNSFSLKRTALKQIGGFVPFLGKRLHAPLNGEIIELCQRLRAADIAIWYEPAAIIYHRVRPERLERAFLTGRAYWHGRSEILAYYLQHTRQQLAGQETKENIVAALKIILPDLYECARIVFLHRPWLFLTRRHSVNEQVQAAIVLAYHWGRVSQQLQLVNHAPTQQVPPAVLLISAGTLREPGATHLAQELHRLGIACTTQTGKLPISWIWQHRAINRQGYGIIHCYRPGAFSLHIGQKLQFLTKLYIARLLGVPVVSTDAGGWWQQSKHMRCLSRQYFEQLVFTQSKQVQTYMRTTREGYLQINRQNSQELRAANIRQGRLPAWDQARHVLGLPQDGFVYLCLADQHTEREILHLITAFIELYHQASENSRPQLLLMGRPQDNACMERLLDCAALNSAIHLCLNVRADEVARYAGAADALVLSHYTNLLAGTIDTITLFHSYARMVVAPDLPQLREILPPHACVFYTPGNREMLLTSLLQAQQRTPRLKEKEADALAAEPIWQRHARRSLLLYRPLLNGYDTIQPALE